MAYSFKPADESVEAGLKRVARSQIESGLEDLRAEELPQEEKVHQIRKRCKKIRGLLRLVRPCFDGYKAENECFRDAARTLSEVRDASAVLETVDEIENRFADELKKAALKPLRTQLSADRDELDETEIEEKLADLRLVFREALDRVEGWTLSADGAEAVSEGAAKTYKRAVKAMAKAESSGAAEDFHDWRKRAKYHWYHLRLDRKSWPPVLEPYADEAHHLSNLLGAHHDLHVLTEAAERQFGSRDETFELVASLCGARQNSLADEALPLGRKLFWADKNAFEDKLETLWQTSQSEPA